MAWALLSLSLSGCLFSSDQIPEVGTILKPEASPSPFASATPCASVSVRKGFGLSPQGFPASYATLPAFFSELEALKDASVMWNGVWRDDAVLGSNSGVIPAAAQVVASEAASRCMPSVLVFGWRSDSTLFIKLPANSTNDWTNTEAKNAFRQMIEGFVELKKPPYVFLGNENDFYFEQNPTDYANWISLYNTLYDAIKLKSPNTQVGPVFNYEHLAGLGSLNGWNTPRWGALEQHHLAKIDVVGITMYPFFQYVHAAQVPTGYLDPLVAKIGSKPIAITETGWPAETSTAPAPAWASSDQEQVDFVPKVFSIASSQNIRLVQWLYLYGMANDGSALYKKWGNVALRAATGEKRPAYSLWVER